MTTIVNDAANDVLHATVSQVYAPGSPRIEGDPAGSYSSQTGSDRSQRGSSMSGSAERISACAPAHPTDDESEPVPTIEGLSREDLLRLSIAYRVAGAAMEAAGASVWGFAEPHCRHLEATGKRMQDFAESSGHRAEFLMADSPNRDVAIELGLEVVS
jgi:hypothetical protein